MELNNLLQRLRETKPLIHCITNPISINQCANAILCAGARPIMAEHPHEVREITETASALMLNMGNITDVRMESMRISSKVAKEGHIPFVLDVVGVACSSLRRRFACELIDRHTPNVIKGNYSEINALFNCEYKCSGVDADLSLSLDSISKVAIQLSQRYKTIVLATGETDIVTDGNKLVYITNGTPQLTTVTGTGCILGALCSCFMAVCDDVDAIVAAGAYLGVCGELSATDKGSGSFMINLMDKLSTVTEIEKEANIVEKL